VLKSDRFRNLAERAEAQNEDAITHHPEYLLGMLKDIDPEQGSKIERILKAFQFKLVLNQVRRQDNPKIGALICKIVEKHLGMKIQFIGNVSFDERVHEAVCRKESFVDQYSYSQATLDLRLVIKGITGLTEEQAVAL
jgi:MinD-like ATPase involved in chromosome partitioning or flagellar assembly